MIRYVALLLMFFCLPAVAQTGCESTGDGPVKQQKDAVKKLDDTYVVRWSPPTQLADAACTPIDDDPAYALTSYEVYMSVDAPISALPPVATIADPAQTSFSGSVAGVVGVRPGAEIYFAVTACNQFGCSDLSEQAWIKLGGPPGKAQSATVE